MKIRQTVLSGQFFFRKLPMDQDLHYGVWVSLSEKSFEDYTKNFQADDQEGTYFGYLCSQIPGYDFVAGIKTNVVVARNRQRPEVIPHTDQ